LNLKKLNPPTRAQNHNKKKDEKLKELIEEINENIKINDLFINEISRIPFLEKILIK